MVWGRPRCVWARESIPHGLVPHPLSPLRPAWGPVVPRGPRGLCWPYTGLQNGRRTQRAPPSRHPLRSATAATDHALAARAPGAWGIPWTEEPGGLQSMRLQRVGHDLTTKSGGLPSHLEQRPKSSECLQRQGDHPSMSLPPRRSCCPAPPTQCSPVASVLPHAQGMNGGVHTNSRTGF